MKKMAMALALCSLLLTLAGCNRASGGYKEGTYTAKAQGYGGEVSVEVVFSSSAILSVKAMGPDETKGVGDKALAELPDKIVKAQRSDVDAVASATVTSNAVKAAVQDCVEQAKQK